MSCLVQDSYLHGQYLPPDEPWHLGGFLSDGGRNMTLQHNLSCAISRSTRSAKAAQATSTSSRTSRPSTAR